MIVSGSTGGRPVARSQPASSSFASRLAFRNASRSVSSPASGASFASCARSVIHPSPIASVIVRASDGFASRSQRRGVTPLVLLLKRSGKISARSFTVVARSSSEWIAATPFVLCEPTIARLAMRTCLAGPSSIRLARATRPASFGKRERTSSSRRRLISNTISRWRGSMSSNQPSGHFSSASGSSVWFVYASVRRVRSQASSQPRRASSRRIRRSSGTASAGCVSFIWIATFSGSALQSEFVFWKRRTRSASEQATRKYSWRKRRP